MTDPNTFETGPIRPPSEAGSYLIRLTRGCPWNRCGFCRSYKRRKFEIRDAAAVEADIDAMARIRDEQTSPGCHRRPESQEEWMVANVLSAGGRTAFLQDGDSLAMKPDHVRRILAHFQKRFPEVERITSYARSRTMANRSVEDLRSYRELGLTRIHIGMESGHDPLLRLVEKGVTGEVHIRGGQNVLAAGIELSEYFMPGLGGREMSKGHALDSAVVLNAINPHFIRLRTLCLGPKLPLWNHYQTGTLTQQTDLEVVKEIRAFVEALDGDRSRIVSDHILNLLGELEGEVATEKPQLLALLDRYLKLDEREQRLFQVARRSGLLGSMDDLDRAPVRRRAESLLAEVTRNYGDDLEQAIRDMMTRFV